MSVNRALGDRFSALNIAPRFGVVAPLSSDNGAHFYGTHKLFISIFHETGTAFGNFKHLGFVTKGLEQRPVGSGHKKLCTQG